MNRSEYTPLMHAVLDGEASPGEAAELTRLLAANPAAQAEFDELQRLFEGLKAIPKAYPPEALSDLYYRRWQMELALRSIKTTLQMDQLSCKTPQTALRELRYAFRLFAPYADRRKVTVFGSARTQPKEPEYQQAVEKEDAAIAEWRQSTARGRRR